MNVRFIHQCKFATLRIIQKFIEVLRIVSKSESELGTFDGEEFIFYPEYFSNNNELLQVIDIGANYGTWSIDFLTCMKNKNIKIVAVEPIPEFFSHIDKFNDERVLAQNYAIGSDGGKIKIAKVGNGATSFPNLDSEYPESKKELQWHWVPTITGDTLIRKLQIRPNLIKIDADGFDFSILKTLDKTLLDFQPIIQFEFTFRFARKAGYTLYEMISYLKERNYLTFVLTSEGKLRPVFIPRLEVLNHQTKNFISVPRLTSEM